MKVQYSYRIEDFEDIAEAADRLGVGKKRLSTAYLLAGVLLVFAPFLASGRIARPEPTLLPISILGLCVLVSPFFRNPRKAAHKFYAEWLDSETYTVEIDEHAIVTKSTKIYTELKWAAFSRYIEAQTGVALVIGGVMYLLPKRAFSEDQWKEFTSLYRSNVSPSKPEELSN
jgi:hypothetical protein